MLAMDRLRAVDEVAEGQREKRLDCLERPHGTGAAAAVHGNGAAFVNRRGVHGASIREKSDL